MTEYLTYNQTKFFIVGLILAIGSCLIAFILAIIWGTIAMNNATDITTLQGNVIFWLSISSISVLGLDVFVMMIWFIIDKVKRR